MFHREAPAWQFSHVIMLNVSNNKFMFHFMFGSNTLAIHFSLGRANVLAGLQNLSTWTDSSDTPDQIREDQTRPPHTTTFGRKSIEIKLLEISLKVLIFLCSWFQAILLCYLNRIMITDFSRGMIRLRHCTDPGWHNHHHQVASNQVAVQLQS